MAERFPGLAARLRERLKVLGYWKEDRPDVRRFCREHDYDARAFYPWISLEKPRYPSASIDRLAHDLQTTTPWLLHGEARLIAGTGTHKLTGGRAKLRHTTAPPELAALHAALDVDLAPILERSSPDRKAAIVTHLLNQLGLIAMLGGIDPRRHSG